MCWGQRGGVVFALVLPQPLQDDTPRRYHTACRFSTGGSGVYLGAHDLFLSEVSGRFELACEKVRQCTCAVHSKR